MQLISNGNALNIYLTNLYVYGYMRNELWKQGFISDLFNNYPNKSELIPFAYICPFDIPEGYITRTFSRVTPEVTGKGVITIADTDMGITLGTDSLYLYVQESGAVPDTLVARYVWNSTTQLQSHLFYNNYLDYSTITEYKLFLPFIGYVPVEFSLLRVNFAINYYFDISTGTLTCNINVESDETGAASPYLYATYTVDAGIHLTVSGADTTVNFQKITKGLLSVGSAAFAFVNPSTAITSSVVNSTVTNAISSTPRSKLKVNYQRYENHVRPLMESKMRYEDTGQTSTRTRSENSERYSESLYRPSGERIASTVNALADMQSWRVPINTDARLSASDMWNSPLTPFIVKRTPKFPDNIFDDIKNYAGFPTRAVYKLNQCNGYTQVGMIHLNDIIATAEELDEIDDLLKAGVLINNPDAPEIDIEV